MSLPNADPIPSQLPTHLFLHLLFCLWNFDRRHAWNAPKQNNFKASLTSLYPPTITGFHHPVADPVRRVLAQAAIAASSV